MDQDCGQPLSWFGQDAEQGDAVTQLQMGVLIANGQGTQANAEVACQWLQLAAEQGEASAWFNLGQLQQREQPGGPRLQQALAAYRAAAAMGFAPAQAALGWMYAKGEGTLQDFVKAHMWFNIAAAGGNTAGVEGREFVASRMSPQHIAQAQDLAREAQKKNLQGYD